MGFKRLNQNSKWILTGFQDKQMQGQNDNSPLHFLDLKESKRKLLLLYNPAGNRLVCARVDVPYFITLLTELN